ncbi:hypothetical protein HYH38_16235 [Clostridium botulinum]|uniref:Helix-turn-helix domain-containing protein n=1 Tax=Clostridium botulinum TaxID=1491 RepID=A0A126JIB6_CLOBO|nr:hypothetical protein [Clostridium botulinum]ALT05434.1 hypothetical protein [Clostridium botulinum]ALT05532.1 hypothetical protein [Clostridium botulinum]ALT05630.1 hypothetical protein [Clostridium botulinum]ALT05730.1 hypothetical protein [Clostridium botulinum]ALT05832.1 hypothetical protein [Clostridium botulinum]
MFNVKDYIDGIEKYKDNIAIYNKLIELKNIYLDINHLNKTQQEIYALALEIVEDLFNPLQIYKEPIIPLSFLQSNIGKILLDVINGSYNRMISINDVVEMSKTEKNKKGYSYQYINKEIKAGKLRGIKHNGSWQIQYKDAVKFLETKNIIIY